MKDRITSLRIKDLKPRDASGFRSEAFQELLRQLQQFEISIFGPNFRQIWMLDNRGGYPMEGDVDYHYQMTFWDCFVAFEDSFDVLFFNHLDNVTEIALCGHHLGQLGRVSEEGHRHLTLKSSQTPFLRSIYLSRYFISTELVAFLLGHSGTLEVITLHDCMPDPYFMDTRMEPYIYWCDFFTALSDGRMKRLRKFTVTPFDQRGLWWPDDCEMIPYEGPNQRVLGYCLTGGSYMLGDDQKAYEKLMKNCAQQRVFLDLLG
jgi:hypothetical protein